MDAYIHAAFGVTLVVCGAVGYVRFIDEIVAFVDETQNFFQFSVMGLTKTGVHAAEYGRW